MIKHTCSPQKNKHLGHKFVLRNGDKEIKRFKEIIAILNTTYLGIHSELNLIPGIGTSFTDMGHT